MTYKKHVKISFASDFSRNAREGNIRLENIEEIAGKTSILEEGTEFCPYIERCNKICFKKPDEYCGVRKFYDKYGEMWNQLGVGS